jgi:hypothetical protein
MFRCTNTFKNMTITRKKKRETLFITRIGIERATPAIYYYSYRHFLQVYVCASLPAAFISFGDCIHPTAIIGLDPTMVI